MIFTTTISYSYRVHLLCFFGEINMTMNS